MLFRSPAIFDEDTGKVVTESEVIAVYLDDKYPDTPKVFPLLAEGNTRAAIAAFDHVFMSSLFPIFPRLAGPVCNILNPASERYFRASKEDIWDNLDELVSPGPIREGRWKEVKEGLDTLSSFLERIGEGKPFYFGDTFSFADIVAVSFFTWLKVILDEESDEWKALERWNNGRWMQLVSMTKNLVVLE